MTDWLVGYLRKRENFIETTPSDRCYYLISPPLFERKEEEEEEPNLVAWEISARW